MLGIPHYEKAFYNQIGSFGDGGKSKIMEIKKIVFPIYITSLDSKYIAEDSSEKLHKGLAKLFFF